MISGCAKTTLALVALTNVGVLSADARILRLRGQGAVGTSTSGLSDLMASVSLCSTPGGDCGAKDTKITGLACKQLELCASGMYAESCGQGAGAQGNVVCYPVMESNGCIVFPGPRFDDKCADLQAVKDLLAETPDEFEEGDVDDDSLDVVVQEEDPSPQEEASTLTLAPMWSARDPAVVHAFLAQHYGRLTLLQRLMVQNRFEQLTQQTIQCLSTCVLCVGKSSADHDSPNVVQKTIHVSRARTGGATFGSTLTTMVGGGVGSWFGSALGSTAGAYNGLTNENNKGVLQTIHGGLKGAAVGGIGGFVNGALYGGAAAHAAHFTHCGAVEYTHSSADRGALGQQVVVGGQHNEVDLGITNTASSHACTRMELVQYSPKQLVKCMRHATMCGNGGTTVALPVPVSDKDECAALAHNDELSLELLQKWSGADLPSAQW